MAKTANQLIKQAYEIAKTMPPAQAAIIRELATVLDVSNVALRQTRTERDALLAEVKSWAKECDRLTERHTKNRTNMHVLEAMPLHGLPSIPPLASRWRLSDGYRKPEIMPALRR